MGEPDGRVWAWTDGGRARAVNSPAQANRLEYRTLNLRLTFLTLTFVLDLNLGADTLDNVILLTHSSTHLGVRTSHRGNRLQYPRGLECA